MSMWEVESLYRERGFLAVCGADEAGAGPLAGPVYAAAVLLPFGVELPGVDDSKKLTEKQREALFPQIQEAAIAWAVTSISPEEIDETNILKARLKAMDQAVAQLEPRPDFALIDGNRDKGIEFPHATVVGGDGKSLNIAAASILAKVSRDRFMVEMDKRYPQYGFARHKGYPTKSHYAALREYGPCPIHRQSFLKKFYAQGGRST